jgi:hypothetical protein
VLENHLVRFASETRLLVAAECCAGGIKAVAIAPTAARVDLPTHAILVVVRVARPYARTQTIDRVVADLDGIFEVLELRDRKNRPEELLLEDAHVVIAREYGRLQEVAVLQVAAER